MPLGGRGGRRPMHRNMRRRTLQSAFSSMICAISFVISSSSSRSAASCSALRCAKKVAHFLLSVRRSSMVPGRASGSSSSRMLHSLPSSAAR